MGGSGCRVPDPTIIGSGCGSPDSWVAWISDCRIHFSPEKPIYLLSSKMVKEDLQKSRRPGYPLQVWLVVRWERLEYINSAAISQALPRIVAEQVATSWQTLPLMPSCILRFLILGVTSEKSHLTPRRHTPSRDLVPADPRPIKEHEGHQKCQSAVYSKMMSME